MVNNKSMNIWMQMLGFEMNDPDRGVARYLDRIGYTPESICALLFHCDFVNLHRGMEEEYVLFRDNCAYHGIPRNVERSRQDWTNYKMRELIAELKKTGIKFYAGIMGSYLGDMFHHEFLTDHPELRYMKRDGSVRSLHCLKRFKDGTYYEDYFAEKLVQTLIDYDCAGVHLSDAFCPSSRVYMADYSSDMVGQFMDHTGLKLPKELMGQMGNDQPEYVAARAEYIWNELREDWICFYEWRWEKFFKTVCSAVHKVGKEVWILGVYCTDPFETRYIQGFDLRKVMEAGVDCVTANILPTGVAMNAPEAPYYFHRIHMDLPLLRGWIGNHKMVTMLGMQDASEEWSVLAHRPIHLERDIFTMNAHRGGGDGTEAATDGMFFCLGDGVPTGDWNFLMKRVEIATSAEVERSWSPLIYWSDEAADRMLHAYIETRRTSPHRQATELFKAGYPFGGALRMEQLGERGEPLFVPNFDMLSDVEKDYFVSASAPWVGTVPADFDIASAGIQPVFECIDVHSDYPMKAFLCNAPLADEKRKKIAELIAVDDGIPSTGELPESDVNSLFQELPFRKLNGGFIHACGMLLQAAAEKDFPVVSDHPMFAMRLKNGKDRLYVYNTYENHYGHAVVTSEQNVAAAQMVSSFPILPPRFLQESNTGFSFNHDEIPTYRKKFQIKLAPAGLAILDIEREEK